MPASISLSIDNETCWSFAHASRISLAIRRFDARHPGHVGSCEDFDARRLRRRSAKCRLHAYTKTANLPRERHQWKQYSIWSPSSLFIAEEA